MLHRVPMSSCRRMVVSMWSSSSTLPYAQALGSLSQGRRDPASVKSNRKTAADYQLGLH